MKKAIGFNLGLRGDLIMSTVAARAFKESPDFKDWKLVLGVAPQFADLLPLFYQHPHFDNFHVYTEYAKWPGPADHEYLARANYDFVFHGMPQHRDEWWKFRHQYAEAAHMQGLRPPADLQPLLTRWFSVRADRESVAIAPFGGNGEPNDKMLSVAQAQGIVNFLIAEGFNVFHLGAPGEPDLFGAPRLNATYFESVRAMLGTRLLIHCDTGMGHVAGAYNHPSFGIYGHRYFGPELVHRIQPRHANFHHITGPSVSEMSIDSIISALRIALG